MTAIADDRNTPELDARAGFDKLATYPYQIATWVDDAGYPVSVAVEATVDPADLTATFRSPAGLPVPTDRPVSLTGSHIRPQPGYGYDERRHVTVWGRATADPDGAVTLTGSSAWGWDEAEVPFFEYSERSLPQSRRYFDALSAERGTPVKPKLSFGFLTLRTTRLPFLTATIIPVVLGILIAASHGYFDLVAAALTVIGAAFVQLGLNVANDVFDTVQGADDANVTPTKFSGGSRVIQYGLVSLRQMAGLATLVLRPGRRDRPRAAGDPRLDGAARHRAGRVHRQPRVHRPAAQVRLSRPWRDRGRARVRADDAAGCLRGPDRRGAVLGAVRGIDPGRAPRRADPVRRTRSRTAAATRGSASGRSRSGSRGRSSSAATTSRQRPHTSRWSSAWSPASCRSPTLLMLLSIPLALRVSQGLAPNYDNPYGLMAIMGTNVQLHMRAGLLLLAAYVIVLITGALAPSVDLFLG